MLSFLSAHALKPINHWHDKPLKRESNYLKFPIIDELSHGYFYAIFWFLVII